MLGCLLLWVSLIPGLLAGTGRTPDSQASLRPSGFNSASAFSAVHVLTARTAPKEWSASLRPCQSGWRHVTPELSWGYASIRVTHTYQRVTADPVHGVSAQPIKTL